ncbi:MAG: 50S ribosomal protein L35, partial [Clostridia bacterium]|nr:50S ribosomal protein L35 [Clostridia bacterium]
ILNKKTRERKRKLRHGAAVSSSDEKTIRRLIQK